MVTSSVILLDMMEAVEFAGEEGNEDVGCKAEGRIRTRA